MVGASIKCYPPTCDGAQRIIYIISSEDTPLVVRWSPIRSTSTSKAISINYRDAYSVNSSFLGRLETYY